MTEQETYGSIIFRGIAGGILMGMANLVPGISGGTMLLAVGIYTAFITSIADVTTLRVKTRGLLLLGSVGCSAAMVILLGAGQIKALVVEHRWVMYSLFIGLTLGGVPLIWKLARPVSKSFWVASVFGFLVMALMALGLDGGGGSEGYHYPMLFFAGLAGSASMILPGVSGGYLLLLLGQYETVLGAIDMIKQGLKTTDMALLIEALHVVIPVGLGVVAGIVGVSNLLKWLLRAYERSTLGVLFGLLIGAVIGLWPFQEGRMPQIGELYHGVPLTAEAIAALKPEKWPVEYFAPGFLQIVMAVVLIVLGFGLTLLIERLGKK